MGEVDELDRRELRRAQSGKIVSTFPVQRDPSVDAVGWVGGVLPEGQPLELVVPTSGVAPTISIDQQSVPIEPSNPPSGSEPQTALTFSLETALLLGFTSSHSRS